jgi:hypothetical protein
MEVADPLVDKRLDEIGLPHPFPATHSAPRTNAA